MNFIAEQEARNPASRVAELSLAHHATSGTTVLLATTRVCSTHESPGASHEFPGKKCRAFPPSMAERKKGETDRDRTTNHDDPRRHDCNLMHDQIAKTAWFLAHHHSEEIFQSP